MSYTYYICPCCKVTTYPSWMGRETRYCSQCGRTYDIDETEAVTVGQSQTGTVFPMLMSISLLLGHRSPRPRSEDE